MAAKASETKRQQDEGIVDLIWTELEAEGLNLPNVPVKQVVKRGIRRITENGKRRARAKRRD